MKEKKLKQEVLDLYKTIQSKIDYLRHCTAFTEEEYYKQEGQIDSLEEIKDLIKVKFSIQE